MMSETDTICAPATATGGALAVIRVSGPNAFSALTRLCSVCRDSLVANTVHFTRIKDDTEVIDECMVSVFKAPHSYTGEDCVELSCHGSGYIINKVLSLLIEKGCRMAEPGEFTKRAYLNGKLDLTQAEAVADLIASTNQATHRLAMSQLRGGISTELARLREQLLKLTSLIELELDFSDHEDLEFADRTELLELTLTIQQHILRLSHSFETGQALKQGIPVAIVGKTNVLTFTAPPATPLKTPLILRVSPSVSLIQQASVRLPTKWNKSVLAVLTQLLEKHALCSGLLTPSPLRMILKKLRNDVKASP